MKKQVIRLTESDLHKIIKESVKRIIKEWDADEYEGRMTDILDDKAYQDDLHNRREQQIEDAWREKNIRLRKMYPGKSEEWYEAMINIFENKDVENTIEEEK